MFLRLSSAIAVVVFGFTLAACGASQPLPTGSTKPPTPPPMTVGCAISPAVTCAANVLGAGDVTAAAAWSAVESLDAAKHGTTNPSPAVVFRKPGIVTVLHAATVYLRADYDYRRGSSGTFSTSAYEPHAYQVSPGGGVVPLAYFDVLVLGGPCAPGGACDAVAGAAVEIIDGEGAGKSALTVSYGSAVFEFLHFNVPFTVRASKEGYKTVVATCAGIVDGADFPDKAGMRVVIDRK